METRVPYQHPFRRKPMTIRYECDSRSLTTMIIDDVTKIYNQEKYVNPKIYKSEVTASSVVPRETTAKKTNKSLKIDESYVCRDPNCDKTFNMVFKLICHENQAHNLREGRKGLKIR